MAVSKRLRYEILRRDNHTCRYCGRSAPNVPLRVDHVVPVALGGTDDPTNLATSCEPCNSGKSSTTPGAPLVAQVQEDAMRWQMAWAVAVTEAKDAGQQRAKDIARVKKNYAAAHKGRHGDAPILPEGWESSVGRWLDLGLPLTLIDKAIASAVGRNKIPAKDRFAYFAGCCWSLLRELQERTQQIIEINDADAEPWGEKYARSVIGTAVMAWRESWMEKHGVNPPDGLDEQVRASALDLFPEYIGAADLISAAGLAAGCKDVNLEPFSEDLAGEEEEEEEDFDIRILKSFFLGWLQTSPDSLPALASDAWTKLSAYAWAASFAGYEDVFIAHGAYWAGRHQDPDTFGLPTVNDILDDDAAFVMEKVVRSATVLERQGEFAQQVKAEHDAHVARVAAMPDSPWGVPDFGGEAAAATSVSGEGS